ncbi:aldo/keto reductase [Ophiocordyceps sinensis CO18]|uniref:Aldo/keto reductase n=1 Tax=Ophiocordyceps sinensis (strain Co18 / CGMCC 3.14243) TaxID=911162 RepID=T5AI29_OPHSC|nr:aldo/keto reductase [Ophiocordyceps sinensis CO18]
MPLIAQSPRSRIILGLMTFGPKSESGARITDLDTFNRALDVFQARGYNEVDTARIYVGGEQEAFTRQAGWKERGLTLATKVRYPANPGDNAADKVVKSVETSLKELGVDCVDAGKFVRLGLSNFAAFEVAEVVMTCTSKGWVRPTVYQGMYNVITRNLEPELFVACRRYGLDIVVYNPIAGGLFSGKVRSKDMVPESGRFSDKTPMGGMYRQRDFREGTFRSMQVIEAAVEKHGLSMIETALRWMVHHSKLQIKEGADGILIGVSSVEQLEDNLENLEKGPLPEDVVRALDEAWMISKAESANYWHGELEYGYDTREALFGGATRRTV